MRDFGVRQPCRLMRTIPVIDVSALLAGRRGGSVVNAAPLLLKRMMMSWLGYQLLALALVATL